MVETSRSLPNPDAQPEVSKTARHWAVAAHLLGLSLYLGVPFGNILGPLLVWLFKRDVSPFVEAQAKEGLNFQISVTIYSLTAGIFVFLSITTFLPLFSAIFIVPLVSIIHIVLTIVGAVRASEGKAYSYPLTLRLVA